MDISKIRIIGINSFIRDKWDVIVVLIIFSLFAVVSFNYYLYSVSGDSISYINIAKAYASGNVNEAINGYWSPLFSWLMVPFFYFSSNPLYYAFILKIVSLIIGFFTIISIRNLYKKFDLDILVKRVFLFCLIPVILYFSLKMNTPDLLVVLILIYYLSLILDPQYFNKLKFGVLCGIVGGFAYLTKSYLFFFFMVHFILFNIFYIYKSKTPVEKKNISKNLILGLAVFFVISGIWIGTLSDKYDKFTISTSGEYNQAIMGPDYLGHHPLYFIGLIEPPGKYSTSIWDEPSFTNLNHWSPLSSWDNVKYEFRLIINNLITLFYIFESFFVLSIIIIVSAIISLKMKFDKVTRARILYLLATIFIYTSGYVLITVEWRYFWFIFILMMFTAFYLVSIFFKNNMISPGLRNVLLILLAFSFVIQPAFEILLIPSDEDYLLSIQLQDYGIHGNLASNDNWGRMNTIAYFLNAKYFGLPKKTNDITVLENELESYNITYFFVWNDDKLILNNYKEITGGKFKNLRIYTQT